MDFEPELEAAAGTSEGEVTFEMSDMGAARSPERGNPCSWRILVTEDSITIFDGQDGQVVSEEVNVQVHVLRIERSSGNATESFRTAAEIEQQSGARELHAFAILGVLAAEGACAAASGLLVVTKADLVCDVDGKRIWEVADVERIPVGKGMSTDAASAGASHLCDGTLRLLCERGFYFSNDYDITHTLQWQKQHMTETNRVHADALLSLPGVQSDLMACAEPRFVWNRRLTEELTQQGVSARWFVPLMQGHVQMVHCSEPHPDAKGWRVRCRLLLISRRGSGRPGTRYNARGLDSAGEVGNLIETEQLVHLQLENERYVGPPPDDVPPGWTSFVQLRGSVPLFWDQSPQGSLRITHDGADAAAAFFRHHRGLEAAYGGQVFYINLLSESSPAEQQLTDALEQQLQTAGFHVGTYNSEGGPPRLYCHFDFHASVHGASQEEFDTELDALVEQVSSFLEWSGYMDGTAREPGAGPDRRRQMGVLRTNCLDCLDRTNVVQFFVAWSWLRSFCWKHRGLRCLVDASFLAADEGPQDSNSLTATLQKRAEAWQKAGASLLDSFFGGALGTSTSPEVAKGGIPCRTDADIKCTDTSQETSSARPLQDKATGDRAKSRVKGSPPALRQLLQEIWADNGDKASQQYTGAGSITSSMLRQGQSTSYSMLERSWQGINRAYQASFQDSQRQECIDLLLGHHSSCSAARHAQGG